MESQSIDIAVLPDGRVEYTIKGVKGSACDNISALLEALGQVEEQERTGEYYAEDTGVHVTIDGG